MHSIILKFNLYIQQYSSTQLIFAKYTQEFAFIDV